MDEAQDELPSPTIYESAPLDNDGYRIAITAKRRADGTYRYQCALSDGTIQVRIVIDLLNLINMVDNVEAWMKKARAYQIAHPVEIPAVKW